MITQNTTQKKIIKALAQTHPNAAAVFRELIRQTADPDEREQIRRAAAALCVKLGG